MKNLNTRTVYAPAAAEVTNWVRYYIARGDAESAAACARNAVSAARRA